MDSSDQYQFDFSDLDELYREVVLDHYRNPRNKQPLDAPDVEKEGFNPFCGDDVILQLKLSNSGSIDQVGFQGQGCSISQSSASMLTELIEGKTVDEAQGISELFTGIMHGNEPMKEDLENLGNLEALQGVKKFPIRIKCVLLAWATLEEAIKVYKSKWAKP